jgi:hypothetical protein
MHRHTHTARTKVGECTGGGGGEGCRGDARPIQIDCCISNHFPPIKVKRFKRKIHFEVIDDFDNDNEKFPVLQDNLR